jgi:tetratricopeptide (TPR) repeat protein
MRWLVTLTGAIILSTNGGHAEERVTAFPAERARGDKPEANLGTTGESSVKVWEEPLVIPTYKVGSPEPNPMFYTHESYQGAEKRIYPYALIDTLTRVREDRTYKALYLENEYVKLSVLPEIGGRVFSALDKTNNYDFFYHQHVIKPALIGMLGAWISGGIEWCAFHHHRNTTFMPVDYVLAENPDGSKTIWVGETERRHRMRWLIGITLFPGKSYIEATVKFFNRTALPHSILCWANVAVHVNDDYEVIFPPSVQVATYHSKIDFTYWPISRGRYRGYDYAGLDINWWKNSPVSNSFFAWNLQEDFMGGYDHGKEAGVVHVANHHIVCGAKLWEWGTGEFGRMWDGILTDEDGPYAELMVGAFSDNQPDYSWIKPYEVKEFKQYWFPVREIGGFKYANLKGAVNLELKPGNVAVLGFQTTSKHSKARAILKAGENVVSEDEVYIGPDRPFRKEVSVPAGTNQTRLQASLISADGEVLISYQPGEPQAVSELPRPVKAPPRPQDIQTVEELYLTGLRVEQIHNPRVDPMDYYEEALKRDADDSRSNIAVGINYIKRGMYEKAEEHLKRAVQRVSADYTRPENAEAYYYLGVAQRAQGKLDDACDNLYRATWDYAFHSAAYQQLAELWCMGGNFVQALEEVNGSLSTNALNSKALNIKAAILRKLGNTGEAKAIASRVLALDPLDFLAMNELYLAESALGARSDANESLAKLTRMMRNEVQSYLELATDYMNCGLLDEAIEVLSRPVETKMPFAGTFPLVHYYLGYLYQEKGMPDKASEYYSRAARMPSDYCFPFRLETVGVLNAAIEANPSDARASYYLGNLLFDLQPEKAIACWEKSRSLDDNFAAVHRNLGWAYYRLENKVPEAIECYEKALGCKRLDPRLYLETDILYEICNVSPEKRLALLDKNHDVASSRNESFVREIMVLVLSGKYDKAIDYLANNFFHVREGGGEIHDVYVDAHLLKGLEYMKEKEFAKALAYFQKASEYPENLSVGRPKNDARAPQVAYHIGMAYEKLGDAQKATEFYKMAADQQDTSRSPETRFHQALCLKKLGREGDAAKVFDGLIESGKKSLAQEESSDFFAKFGERETKQARQASAHFIIGLGLLGKARHDEAKQEFSQAAKLNVSHLWARYQLAELE